MYLLKNLSNFFFSCFQPDDQGTVRFWYGYAKFNALLRTSLCCLSSIHIHTYFSALDQQYRSVKSYKR